MGSHLWVRNDIFSWWDCPFQLAPGFYKAIKCQSFLTTDAEFPHPYMGFFGSVFFPYPPRRGEKFPLCVWPPVLSSGGAIGCPAVCETPSQTVCWLTWWFGRFVRLKLIRSRAAQVDRGFVFAWVWWVPVFPDAYNSTLSAVLCIPLFLAALQTH
jgi:hypothetical protein